MTVTAPIPTMSRDDTFTTRTQHNHVADKVEERDAAMLAWAHAREDRATLSNAEYDRRRNQQFAMEQRELKALRLMQRLGL